MPSLTTFAPSFVGRSSRSASAPLMVVAPSWLSSFAPAKNLRVHCSVSVPSLVIHIGHAHVRTDGREVAVVRDARFLAPQAEVPILSKEVIGAIGIDVAEPGVVKPFGLQCLEHPPLNCD